MNNEQKCILRNIIYAVETGGQIYGQRDYASFTEARTNSENEKAITIGAGQWYATEARRLLKQIREADRTLFETLDTANIGGEVDAADWTHYDIAAESEKAGCIVRIIDSEIGRKCQDALIDEQMEKYVREAAALGVLSADAQSMCANFRHQGGYSAMKRVIEKTIQPYSLENLYAACQSDTGNQVGAYKTRQRFVYESLRKYMPDEITEIHKTAQGVLNVMRNWLEFSEANGKFKEIIDLYNSVKPLPRGYAVKYTDEWCDVTVSAAGIKAGCSDLIGRECGCEEHVKLFKKMGIWNEDGTVKPELGWIIVYNWDNTTQPNDGYSDHIGYVEEVNGNIITCIEGNKGEAVGRRYIPIGYGCIRGYGMPKYNSSNNEHVSDDDAGQNNSNSVQSYTVKKGDTLSEIAEKYKTTHQRLAAYNGILDPDKIIVGQVIKIPGDVNLSPQFKTYKVQRGDTLSEIAVKHGTTFQELAAYNGISDPDKIITGQILKIPN